MPDKSASPTPRHVVLLPGDGIGPEIMAAVRPVIEYLFPHWVLNDAAVGWSEWTAHGNPVPDATWAALNDADAAILVAITSKPAAQADAELAPELRDRGYEYKSPVLQLRQRLDLFANIRPSAANPLSERASLTHKPDFCIIRENTEGLYTHDYTVTEQHNPEVWQVIGEDPTVSQSVRADDTDETSVPGKSGGEVAVALRVTTTFGWKRLARTAAKVAIARHALNPDRANGLQVTVADKPNVLRESGRVIAAAVAEVAEEYPQVTFVPANADVVAMQLVTDPQRFDVIIAENLIGDILSDLAAGITGGLGLAASASIGPSFALFEPVHGSAPDIAGQGIANPAATLLSVAMCAEHFGEAERAEMLRKAVYTTIEERPTADLGGTATTVEFVNAVSQQLEQSAADWKTAY